MTETHHSFPHLTMEGTSKEVAQQTAEQLGESAQSLFDFRRRWLARHLPQATSPNVENLWSQIWEVHQRETPLAAEESATFAEEFGIHPGEWLAYSGMSDWMDYLRVHVPTELGCSTLLLPSQKSPDLSGVQTWDLHAIVEEHAIVLSRKIEGTLPALTLTTSMGHAHFGVNASGVCVGTNNLQCIYPRIGVTFASAIMHVLHHVTCAEEGADLLQGLTLMSGHNYILSDTHGTVLNVEQSTRGVVVRRVEEPTSHTNHYLEYSLQGDGNHYSASSEARLATLNTLHSSEDWSDNSLEEWSQAFHDHEAALCRHPEHDEDTATCALIAYHSRQRSLSIIRGLPCQGTWKTYSISEKAHSH